MLSKPPGLRQTDMTSQMRPIIAVIDDYEDFVAGLDAYAALKAQLPDADIRVLTAQPLDQAGIQSLEDVEYLVLIRERTRITPALLQKLPALKAIVQTGSIGAGATSHVDVAACRDRGVFILEGRTSDGHSAAELTWALILAASRNIHPYMDSLASGGWQQGAKVHRLGRSLHGQTLGILGYGRIGQLLSQYAAAFGMDTQVWGRENSRAAAKAHGVTISTSRDRLFETSDVLAIQLRLNEETLHSVTARDLSLMKPTSLLINTSRAALIAPGVLLEGLRRGRPSMAAIDVHDVEPVSASALTAMPTCIATPHIGYVERNSFEILFGSAFKNLVDYVRGQPPSS